MTQAQLRKLARETLAKEMMGKTTGPVSPQAQVALMVINSVHYKGE